MSRNIRWDNCLLKNVLSLVEALLELSEQQEDNSKPTLWVEWREDKLRVTGYETKQTKAKRSRTDEVGTKEDWDYFLPHKHENKPVADRYRIFEPQWKEVILLWLGRDEDDVSDADKEAFIKKLVEFDDGCGNHNFYYRAYFLAAAGIAEFKECHLTDKVVKQIVEWRLGKFNSETQKWERFVRKVEESAEEVLQETNRENAINALVDLIRNPDVDNDTKEEAAGSLEQIGVGNENAINALVDLICNPDVDYSTKSKAAESLGQIGVGNENAINALVDLICNPDVDYSTKSKAAESLSQIDPGNENAINALVDLIRNPDVHYSTKYPAVESLGQIDPGKEIAINALVELIRNPDVDNDTKSKAAESLEQIDTGNEIAINALVELIRNPDVDYSTKYYAAIRLEQIDPGNENAINGLVDLIRNPDVDYSTQLEAAESLGQIGVGNENAIKGLVDLIRNPNVDYSTKYPALESLGQIGVGNENAIKGLVDLIRNPNVDYSTKRYAAGSLGEILTDEHIPIVLKALKAYLSVETSKNTSYLLDNYYRIIWKCAQNMTYPEFHQAWH